MLVRMLNMFIRSRESLPAFAHDTCRATVPSIISQIEVAAQNPLPAVIGALLGALVPSATFMIGHYELTDWRDPKALIVLGGLVFSALTVFRWGRLAFGSSVKALGFVILAEGVMTFCSTAWLSLVALGYLVLINAIATGCRIALDAVGDRALPLVDSSSVPTVTPMTDMNAQVVAAPTSLEARLDANEQLRMATPEIKRSRKRTARKPNTRQLQILAQVADLASTANLLGTVVG